VVSDVGYILELGIDEYEDPNTLLTWDQVGARLSDISLTFKDIGYAFLLLCLIDLGLSFLYASTRSKKGHNIAIIVTGVMALIICGLTIGRMGKEQSLYSTYYNDAYQDEYGEIYFPDFDFNQFHVLDEVEAALSIFLFVLSLAVLGFAIFVMVRCDPDPQLRPVSLFPYSSVLLFQGPCANILY
jgi:hypothetical protein